MYQAIEIEDAYRFCLLNNKGEAAYIDLNESDLIEVCKAFGVDFGGCIGDQDRVMSGAEMIDVAEDHASEPGFWEEAILKDEVINALERCTEILWLDPEELDIEFRSNQEAA